MGSCFPHTSYNYGCGDLDFCLNYCNGDQDCEQNCQIKATLEAENLHENLLQCYDNYQDFCMNEESPEECIRNACRTEYAICYDIDPGSIGGNTCSYEGTDLSCNEIVSCMSSCSQQACMDKGSVEGQFQFNAAIQCIIDNCMDVSGDQQAFEECQTTNCMTELQTCFPE